MFPVITFREIRHFVSRIDRISICKQETLFYENFECISEVPHSYDALYLYGFGEIQSEFQDDAGHLHFCPCMEIMLSETPRTE